MRVIAIPFALIVGLLPVREASCADEQNPYDEGSGATLEERVQMLSARAKATLRILNEQKFEAIELRMDRPYETFDVFRKRMAQHGVTVRLKHYGQKQESGEGTLPLANIPIRAAMYYFDEVMGWGWIIYEDGSITYFDNVCTGNWPKDGVFCHEGQFEAGKPENIDKEASPDSSENHQGEQGGTGQPATSPESDTEGSDKPQPEAEGLSR